MIETRLLYYFLAIAREQSITKAAETLHVTQPTLSKQMMDLEYQLGKKLLIRGKKKITLTEDGMYLRSRAQEILDIMDKTESSLRCGEDITGGDVWFGCGESPTMDLIVKVFSEITAEYPLINFHIFSGDAETVTENIERGILDMGLLLGPVLQDKYDYIYLNTSDSFGMLMPENCTLSEKEYITLDDIKGLPLIVSEQTVKGNHGSNWFSSALDNLNIIGTYNLIYNATFMVEHGMGYAYCIKDLVNCSGRNLTFRPMKPDINVPLYIMMKKYQTFSPAVNLFLERLKIKINK
jgi:DNA-binding transcriptional LysR family regulator